MAGVEAFLVSTGVVALGEMGDKTQLLAVLLAVKFRKPVPIVLGILVATLVNHATAGLVGAWVARSLGADVLRWVIGASFIAMAGWMLVPDQIDEGNAGTMPRFGVFGTTLVAFFLAEMGRQDADCNGGVGGALPGSGGGGGGHHAGHADRRRTGGVLWQIGRAHV